MVTPADIPPPRRILNATDRCDWGRCGAAAYKRWVLESGALSACGHHAEAASEKLDVLSVYFIDERWAIP
jgi:hypothetical protein